MSSAQLAISNQLREQFFEQLDNAFATLLSLAVEVCEDPHYPVDIRDAVLNWLNTVKQEVSDLPEQIAA